MSNLTPVIPALNSGRLEVAEVARPLHRGLLSIAIWLCILPLPIFAAPTTPVKNLNDANDFILALKNSVRANSKVLGSGGFDNEQSFSGIDGGVCTRYFNKV